VQPRIAERLNRVAHEVDVIAIFVAHLADYEAGEAVGSLPIRAGKHFSSGRKLGKTHQNILVFVKGSGKKAADRCGTVDVDESMFDGIETVGGDEG
jgi:hypothetical protein